MSNDTVSAMECELAARAKDRAAGSEGTDESFEKVEHSLAHKKGVHDPKALAAWIGREHGKIK